MEKVTGIFKLKKHPGVTHPSSKNWLNNFFWEVVQITVCMKEQFSSLPPSSSAINFWFCLDLLLVSVWHYCFKGLVLCFAAFFRYKFRFIVLFTYSSVQVLKWTLPSCEEWVATWVVSQYNAVGHLCAQEVNVFFRSCPRSVARRVDWIWQLRYRRCSLTSRHPIAM